MIICLGNLKIIERNKMKRNHVQPLPLKIPFSPKLIFFSSTTGIIHFLYFALCNLHLSDPVTSAHTLKYLVLLNAGIQRLYHDLFYQSPDGGHLRCV